VCDSPDVPTLPPPFFVERLNHEVVMAPTQITEDYYAILEISQTADLTGIKSSYRRLAKAKHPDKNCGNPNATAEFQLVSPFPPWYRLLH
jgi:DnaJ-domain-containing protein 1